MKCLLLAIIASRLAASTITFDTIPEFTAVGGQTINGVLFTFTSASTGDQPVVLDYGTLGNLQGHALELPGESDDGTRAVLTMAFPGPMDMLFFQFAIPSPDCQCDLRAGFIDLFDSKHVEVNGFALNTIYDPVSHMSIGGFSYSGLSFVSAEISVANLLLNETTPAIDMITFAAPEAGTLVMVGLGLVAIACLPRFAAGKP